MRLLKHNTYAPLALILRTDGDPYSRAADGGESVWFGAVGSSVASAEWFGLCLHLLITCCHHIDMDSVATHI